MRKIADISVLFCRVDSIYKVLGCDTYDINRNALLYSGSNPVICHPPCRAWGRLRHFAKPREGERELALFAINKIREVGGCLEHPHGSQLFGEILPLPGQVDEFGGYTISINQHWFGHRCEKKTFIYIVGCKIDDLPDIPLSFDAVTHVIASSSKSRKTGKKEVSKKEREATPVKLAKWLIEVALLCR